MKKKLIHSRPILGTTRPLDTRFVNPYPLPPLWLIDSSPIVNHFRDVPSASDTLPKQFSDTQRTYYTGKAPRKATSALVIVFSRSAPHHTDVPSPRPVILSKSIAWNDLLSYLRTFSSLQTYHERFPDDLHHSDGDIAVRFWRTLMQEAGIQEGKTLEGVDQVHVEWPMVVLLFKKL